MQTENSANHLLEHNGEIPDCVGSYCMVQNYFWSGATIVIYMHRTEVLDTCFNRDNFSVLFVSELQLEDSTSTLAVKV